MIRWITRLYVGDKLKSRKEEVVASINQQKSTFGVYCIIFASNSANLFDIVDANELLFSHYQRLNVCIVGIAKGKTEAAGLVQDMLMEIYLETGEFKVRAFFT
jgi:hypothetical protein